ncbi:hypothetical protein MTO96_046918, partial [Rhipicephalus appendiculatus]
MRRSGKPIAVQDVSDVVAECRGSISLLLKKYKYQTALENIICIEFASDSAHDTSTGSLTYRLVLPVPPNFVFPRDVLRNVHEIFEKPLALFGDDVTPLLT